LLLAVLLPVILLLASIAGVAGSTLAQDAQPGQMPELTPTPARFFFPLAHRQPLTPKDPKPATEFTKAANAALAAELPFGDTQAYTDVQRNLIAPLLAEVITTTNGVAWDPQKYAFIPLYASTPDTVNPSLWRQSQLVNYGGLFQVTDRIYQVRNNDLSNLTIIEGDTGLIIVDPLVSVETARAALDLYRANRPMQNVVAVIYTHSHVDHFGGVLGVTSQQAVDDGRCKSMRPTFFWRRPAPKTSTPVTQWGNAAVVQHLQLQRDLFRFMHDQTLNLAN
jgi:alkyl sulfatase BDS1-like metallo-beta-lactamase superfamily hydrolase